jgi:hypothetical protein
MSLPRAVEEQGRKADEAWQQAYNPQQTPPPAPTPPEPVGSQEPPPAPPENAEQDSWENRYKILSGKYNAEVPRLASENRDLKSQLRLLEDRMKKLESGAPAERYVKPEEVEEYGENLVDLIRRAAREEVAAKQSEIEALKAKVDGFEGKVTANVEVDFYSRLSDKVSDWRVINDDPRFHTWLNDFDDYGNRRQDMLSMAESEKNAEKVAKFFDAFKKSITSQAAAANSSLEQQVAPDVNRAVAPPKGKRLWTRAEITEFYNQMRRGAIKASDAVALEADIQAAIVEGRIR